MSNLARCALLFYVAVGTSGCLSTVPAALNDIGRTFKSTFSGGNPAEPKDSDSIESLNPEPSHAVIYRTYGITTVGDFKAAVLEMKESGYFIKAGKPSNYQALFAYLSDREIANKTSGMTAVDVMENRQKESKAKTEAKVVADAKAEAQRRAAEKKSRMQALASLKVKNIGLGDVSAPCNVREETYVDIHQKPYRLQYECSFGPTNDRVMVVFAGDGKTVVRVFRKQFLSPSDPEAKEVVEAAVRFYGPPSFVDKGNWFAMYGNPKSIGYSGHRLVATDLSDGSGLSVEGKMCGVNYPLAPCGNPYMYAVYFDLIDQLAHDQSIKDGKARLLQLSKNRVNSLKF